MPDIAVHAVFGERVFASLSKSTQKHIWKDPWLMALFGPDPWFVHLPPKKQEGRGRRMHTTQTGAFLTGLLAQARSGGQPEAVFSYLAGFICHYTLDATAHPYIIRRTISEFTRPGSHRAFEHTMDVRELQRRGLWGQAHPLTGSPLMPALRLPPELQQDLDAVYHRVYGWKNCWQAMNRDYAFFRFLYRHMENPHGILCFLARLTNNSTLRSLAYGASYLAEEDVENLAHRPWTHSHDASLTSVESLSDLMESARQKAVRMIEAAAACIWGPVSLEEASAVIGNYSYLSGLPMGDPRNWVVPSMSPPEENE